ncbi:glycosyltransferase [uncultured Microbacterium sp.]|uniref:glycosyltransferase n=1 Tax=uncultured Microbacterium sp. TaxID=191216 RepID=UPI0026015314|nr:glycosyltransferase [uncultured Microbacterium sp.]
MTPDSAPRLVAHLVDRTTGGVPVAVRSYIRTSPPAYRHVIVSPPVAGRPAPVWAGVDAAHAAWDTSTPLRALRDLRGILRRGRFDVVHAHSSFPGAYARMLRSARTTRVVYTPHCFAFTRTDVSFLHRAVYRAVERTLAGRTTVLAACGPGERDEAWGVGIPAHRVVVVPNLPSVSDVDARSPRAPRDGVLRLGMLGRWSPQKDPACFIDRVANVRRALADVDVQATWIGDGSAAPGIRVTGWVGIDRVRRELEELDVYLHTAAWEGFPIAILDADAAGLPILARRIRALPDLPAALSLDEGAAALVAAVRERRFAAWSLENRRGWRAYLGPRDARSQGEALARAWG